MNQGISNETLEFLRGNTAEYIKIIQGEHLEEYQEAMCNMIDAHERIAIKACHAVGKTYTLGHVVDALIKLNPYSIILTTAPTFRQVKDLLWNEIRSAHNKSPSYFKFGTMNQVEFVIKEGWYAKGFSPSNGTNSEQGQGTNSNFQGYHAEYMTIIIFDEATGVEPAMWKLAEGMLNSGEKVKFICIANPTSRNCDFFKAYHNKSWAKFEITCFDSPNLIANGITNRIKLCQELEYIKTLSDSERFERLDSYKKPVPHLINLRWVIEKAEEWGLDHPLFLSKVLGEFPLEDHNVLIPERLVKLSRERRYDIQTSDSVYIGVDVARFGTDSSVFTEIVGWQQTRYPMVLRKQDTMDVVIALINFIEDSHDYGHKDFRVAIDGGFGHGVIDIMLIVTGQKKPRDQQQKDLYGDLYCRLENVTILEINFGASDWVKWYYGWKDEKELTDPNLQQDRRVQEDRENYLNYKAKMFDLLARDMRNSLAIADSEVYLKELPSIVMLPKDKMQIESKDDYKKRTGENSPDSADSLALANVARYVAVAPKSYLQTLIMEDNRVNDSP